MPPTFAHFEILGKLGSGGMGTVYKARQPELDRVVALKVMNPGTATPEAFARFEREAEVIGKLRHPNIVRLYTVGQHRNRAFFTMDYIPGRPLSKLIEEAKTPEERWKLLALVATVARAVHYAHTQNVVHRDLKPSNIIVSEASGTGSGRRRTSTPWGRSSTRF